jgi:hypothetical protein
VQQLTKALLQGADRRPLAQAVGHVEQLYNKHRATQMKVEEMRNQKNEATVEDEVRNKKEGLMRKIADFEASKGRSKAGAQEQVPKILKKSNIITEERFDCIEVKDVIRNSKGEVITLQCPITQKVKKPTEHRIGNKVILPESKVGPSKGQESNKENKSKTPNKIISSTSTTKPKDCKTNRIKDKDDKIVYANYNGKEVKIVRKNSDEEKKAKKMEEDKLFSKQKEDNRRISKILQPIEPVVKQVDKPTEDDEIPFEVAGMIHDELDYLEAERLRNIREKIRQSNVNTYQYLEDFLVSKAKKMNYHNFDDPNYDPRPISYKLAQEADVKLAKSNRLKFQNLQDEKNSKGPPDSKSFPSMTPVVHLDLTSPSHEDTADPRQQRTSGGHPETSSQVQPQALSSLVAAGMRQRAEERALQDPAEVQAYLAELAAEHRELEEKARAAEEAERLEAEANEKKKAEKFEAARKEAEAKEKKRLDQEKMLRMRAKAMDEEKEFTKKLEQKLLEETLKIIANLQLPTFEEESVVDTGAEEPAKFENEPNVGLEVEKEQPIEKFVDQNADSEENKKIVTAEIQPESSFQGKKDMDISSNQDGIDKVNLQNHVGDSLVMNNPSEVKEAELIDLEERKETQNTMPNKQEIGNLETTLTNEPSRLDTNVHHAIDLNIKTENPIHKIDNKIENENNQINDHEATLQSSDQRVNTQEALKGYSEVTKINYSLQQGFDASSNQISQHDKQSPIPKIEQEEVIELFDKNIGFKKDDGKEEEVPKVIPSKNQFSEEQSGPISNHNWEELSPTSNKINRESHYQVSNRGDGDK